MSASRDEKTGKWTAQCYYENWKGEKKHKKKRGFATKKEALEWEREFLKSTSANMDMMLGAFVDVYFRDKAGELKERTIKNKRYMIEAHVLPYFENKQMNEISPSDIIQWQNAIRAKGYSQTYLRMVQNQITALFTHASNIYNLNNNPCKKVKKMGKSDADKLNFWTKDEYDCFINGIDRESKYYVIFEILFWTGCREGELLALTKGDISFENNQISITKTYYRTGRQDVITEPKTKQSVRTVEIPEFLKKEIKDFVDGHYGMPDDKRLFPIVQEAVQHKMKRQIAKAGVKNIRVHDDRVIIGASQKKPSKIKGLQMILSYYFLQCNKETNIILGGIGMASGDLFRPFSLRFSLKNEKHVKILQKFNDKKLNEGRVKNQIVMDALEMYFNALENKNGTKDDKLVTKDFLEQRLEKFKQECKEETLGALLRIFVGSRMLGQPFMVPSSNGKRGTEGVIEDGKQI